MSRKKKIIRTVMLILAVALVLHIASYMIYENYRLGQRMYKYSERMATISEALADVIGDLETEFQNNENKVENVNIRAFELTVMDIRLNFGMYTGGFYGEDDVPISREAASGYLQWIEKLWELACNEDKLEYYFNTEEKLKTVVEFKEQLYHLVDTLQEFRGAYEQLSAWERWFTDWRAWRDELSEAVKIA